MDIRNYIFGALLISSSISHSAIDNQLIQSKVAEAITLSGRVGEVALFSIQADDDDDAEIFATASSQIGQDNDHWVLLDLVAADYQIISTGKLQKYSYLSSHQVSFSEILIGHNSGLISSITFADEPASDKHTIKEEQFFLSELNHTLLADPDIDTNIRAIVNLQGTDLINYTVICSESYLHILEGNDLNSSLEKGGYCQSGNVDYEEISSGVYNDELVLADGSYLNFDGSSWQVKSSLASDSFGSKFKIANIDDDDAYEILTQHGSSQLQSFSPSGAGSRVYISGIQSATSNFNTIDINDDGVSEIIFDYISQEDLPQEATIKLIAWDDANDTHTVDAQIRAPFKSHTPLKYLPKKLISGLPSDYSLFVSNSAAATPTSNLLYQLSALDLSQEWSGLIATGSRSFDVLSKTLSANSISDYSIAQLEQTSLAEDTYEFSFKFLDAETLSNVSVLVPDYIDDEIVSVASFTSYDFDGDGLDELHAGGTATYAANVGLLMSSNLDGSDFSRLDTPTIESVTAFHLGDVNLLNGTDIIATGKNNGTDDGAGIGIHINLDGADNSALWFAPGSGDTDFKKLIASNFKGTIQPEILGLHTQLTSIDPNANPEDSIVYNLSNLDLAQFTPIKLLNREYEYALATDAAGSLLLIEPKDFDVLSIIDACENEISSLHTIKLNNTTDVAIGICGNTLKSWVVEYDLNIIDYGYSLFELATFDLGELNGASTQLESITTDDDVTHLFALSDNKLSRLEVNSALGEDPDFDNYPNYRDVFPTEATQWKDDDLDSLGDNQSGNNPDPSLNDIDNDGVLDSIDPDNNPENDLDPANDTDHGSPVFGILPSVITNSSTADQTLISLATPTVSDIYDTVNGNSPPQITVTAGITELVENGANFEGNLTSGLYNVKWVATDTSGNSASKVQQLALYPMVSFELPSSKLSESQTSTINVVLSGKSPVYPFSIDISVNLASASNEDLDIDSDVNLSLTFNTGETEKTIDLAATNDLTKEDAETFSLILLDTFDANTWTVDETASLHEVTITDPNISPKISTAIYQGGSIAGFPNVLGGVITLDATISDSNESDTHSYQWDLSPLGLSNSLLEDVQIDPVNINPGSYSLTLTVTDNGFPSQVTQESILLMIDYGDTDKDGYKDNVDAFPNSATEWSDSDGDGYSDEVGDEFPDLASEFEDTDKDGVGNNADPFDNDPSETKDTDGDGVGDNTDVFPTDKNETIDSDGDGVGNNADPFDDDPSETRDTDGDGVGDNTDAFPNNKNETIDSDGDGVGDNLDAFDNDASESIDSDGDGVGNNSDAFPKDATETKDTDGDGIGDNADEFPGDSRSSSEIKKDSLSTGSNSPLYLMLFLSLILIRKKSK